jgi:hypothetical protein
MFHQPFYVSNIHPSNMEKDWIEGVRLNYIGGANDLLSVEAIHLPDKGSSINVTHTMGKVAHQSLHLTLRSEFIVRRCCLLLPCTQTRTSRFVFSTNWIKKPSHSYPLI